MGHSISHHKGGSDLRSLRGPVNTVSVFLVLVSLLLSSGIAGSLLSEQSLTIPDYGSPDPSQPTDVPFEELREGVSPLLLAKYNSLFDYSDVLVIRNMNSPISVEIADYFIQQRNIPPENICNVTTSTTEVIDRTTFNNLRSQVENNMTTHGLVDKINIIVTTKGVPLKVSDFFDQMRASVDSELALINDINSGAIGNMWWFLNPYFNATEPFNHTSYHMYIVTRLSGYTSEDAKGLVDKATRSIGRRGRFVLDVDPRRDGSPGYKVGNDWMRVAYDILTARGFQVFIDQNNTFVNNQTGLAGYSSWGSNDGNWYRAENTNVGFETDGDGDLIPDDWFKTDNPGLSEVIMSGVDPYRDIFAVKMNRSQSNDNYTAISQNFTLTPERRYYLTGVVNLTNVSGEKGVHLQIKSYDKNGTLMGTFNGSARTGTTTNYVGFGQIVYEPQVGASKLVISAILSKSKGLVYVDDVILREIKPHNTWIDGAVGETYVSTGGRSFTYLTRYGQSLVADLIKNGISGIKGYVYEPYLSAVAHPNILFERYTSGYSLAESFAMASEISLSWMDVIIGDPKVAPYNRSFISDLAIEGSNYTVSNDEIVLGSNVSFSAIVENRGNYPAVNATVTFYMGHPSSGGLAFGNFTLTVNDKNWMEVNFSWEAKGFLGEYDICVFVDPEDNFFELDEGNNLVCKRVRISDGIYLRAGWNLISLPLLPQDTNLAAAFQSIDGQYDMVRYYDSWDMGDPWKMYSTFKPIEHSDLRTIDNKMGFWIHMLNSAVLPLNGSLPSTTRIDLYAGWNLIGHPSLTDRSIEDIFAGLPLERIEGFDEGAPPYLLQQLDTTGYMAPGKGYWVKVSGDCNITISG
ncbi:MAG: TIGR03790 family protein [Methanobacteriota archaeon]|nr:MAG: TIGR03790 family protein [Euryarchaeota archaeon]